RPLGVGDGRSRAARPQPAAVHARLAGTVGHSRCCGGGHRVLLCGHRDQVSYETPETLRSLTRPHRERSIPEARHSGTGAKGEGTMAERPSVDWNKMSTASRILSIAGLLYFIDLFLTWNRVCGGGVCATVSGWHGIGILNG